jgi:hypothetical protein
VDLFWCKCEIFAKCGDGISQLVNTIGEVANVCGGRLDCHQAKECALDHCRIELVALFVWFVKVRTIDKDACVVNEQCIVEDVRMILNVYMGDWSWIAQLLLLNVRVRPHWTRLETERRRPWSSRMCRTSQMTNWKVDLLEEMSSIFWPMPTA